MRLREIDSSEISEEIMSFSPIECMDCGYDDHIPKRFFAVEPDVNNEKEYNELAVLHKY